jgi:bacteriorhodopsin
MVRVARLIFAGAAWILFAALIVQVFLAGVGLFVSEVDSFAAHRNLGWILHLSPILVLLLAWAARAPRGTILMAVGLLVVMLFQPFLPGLRDSLPLVAALHPVNALAIVAFSWEVARRATVLAREPAGFSAEGAGST